MKTEIWKDIEGYIGLYQVSNFGRVKSLKFGKERVLQPGKNREGYFIVSLCKDGKQKMFRINRLVASAFLKNPENNPCVNHKDEDKTNNFAGTPENDYMDGNLEWCSYEYNNNYGTRNVRSALSQINGKTSKTVLQFSKTGDFIREWESTAECRRNGFHQGAVSYCCNGKQKSHKGFIWRYK